MSDLIDRQAAIDALADDLSYYGSGDERAFGMSRAIGIIEKLPLAQPNRIKGRWLHGEAYPHHLYCSVCFRTALPNDEYVERWNLHMNFCPNCGADMRGDEDE